MAQTPRPSRSMKVNPFHEAGAQRVEAATQVAGLKEAFAQMFKEVPQWLGLQQGLIEGMARAQEREARRLAEGGRSKDEPRLAQLALRRSRVAKVARELGSQLTATMRAVETFQTEGLFHGYVMQADGKPASGHQVRLRWQSGDGQVVNRLPLVLERQAQTDGEGYFRISLLHSADDKEPPHVPADKAGPDVVALMASLMEDEPAPATAAAAAASDVHRVQPESQVQVFDPEGKLVLEDPMPPTFERMAADLRWYVLGLEESVPGVIKRG